MKFCKFSNRISSITCSFLGLNNLNLLRTVFGIHFSVCRLQSASQNADEINKCPHGSYNTIQEK